MALDPTTSIGKLRLRVADYSDLPYLPDSVYQSVLDDNDNKLPRSAIVLAYYILGILAHKTHRKMGLQLEVWGKEAFDSYKEFLLLTVNNPAFMNLSILPYSKAAEFSPLIQFADDWNKNYAITQSQDMAFEGSIGPNDGSLYGARTVTDDNRF